jgi:predicted glycosyltransferase involved in capsule biosynthesis
MQATVKISLIIPIRLTGATFEGAERLARICDVVPQDLFDILISDYGTAAEHRAPIDEAEARSIRVVRHPSPHDLFSIGRARDFGVQMSTAPVILFNDIDFLGTEAMYRAIHAEVVRRGMAQNPFDFFCAPVLFLTESGTRDWLAARDDAKPFSGSLTVEALEQEQVDVQSVAYGSSAMVINRNHYLSLGGHDPRFTGHGAEDYDLLHRLSTLSPKGPRPHDYFTDYKDNGVRKYWGFRPFFALYGLDVLPRGIHLVHLWHPRRMEKGYFRPAQNFRLLKRIMKRFDRTGGQPMPLPSLGAGTGKWFVVYGGPEDLERFRQLLPMSTGYELVQAASVGEAARKIETLGVPDGVTDFFVGPGVAGDPSALASLFAPDTRAFFMRGADASDVVTVTDRSGEVVATGRLRMLRAPFGTAAMACWESLSLPGLPPLASGTIPPMQDAGAALFESFGRDQVLTKDKKTRPRRKKKSSWFVRVWRRLTGY